MTAGLRTQLATLLTGVAAARTARAVVRHRRAGEAARAEARWSPAESLTRSGPLAVRTLGDAGTPVVLLHGLAGSEAAYGAEYEALASRHRLVVPDLLGFGGSPKPASGYTLADHADALAACLDWVDPAMGPAVVFGHSFGGLVALSLARRHPERVAGLVIAAPLVHRSPAEARRRTISALSRSERILCTETPWARLACTNLCMRRPGLARRLAVVWRNELPRPLARQGVRHTWESYRQSFAEITGGIAAPDWISGAGVPVHMVTGGADLLPDMALLRDLEAAGAPRVTLEVVPGADHRLPLTHPDACIEAVAAVAERTGASAVAAAGGG